MIIAENLTRTYHIGEAEVHALRGVSLEIVSGEFVAIVGSSGSGKSTLLHILGALDQPTSGRVYLGGDDLSSLSEDELAEIRAKKIGFVFQFHNLIPTLTALENLELPMVFAGVKADERRKRAERLLREVGLGDRLEHTPLQLSGGQQQRVAIARALANEPDVILADEPTGELDSDNSRKIMETLIRLREKSGVTLLVVTHDPEVAAHADRVLKMRDGRIEEVES